MQHITILVLVALFLFSCHNLETPKRTIEEAWTKKVDGVFLKGEYIEIGESDRLYIRYGPISDSGVELERVIKGIVVWRVHAKSLGVPHSKYLHEVFVSIDGNLIDLESKASGGNFREKRSLDTGELIERY